MSAPLRLDIGMTSIVSSVTYFHHYWWSMESQINFCTKLFGNENIKTLIKSLLFQGLLKIFAQVYATQHLLINILYMNSSGNISLRLIVNNFKTRQLISHMSLQLKFWTIKGILFVKGLPKSICQTRIKQCGVYAMRAATATSNLQYTEF